MNANQQVQQVSPSLLTDRYEFSMLASAIRKDVVDRPAVFEAFARHLPDGRRYGLLAGLGRLLPQIEAFTFDPAEVDWLLAERVIDVPTAAYLRDFRFTGTIHGLREGDVYFPGTPVLTVEAPLGQGYLLETLILSVFNHDVAIASAAARMVTAAGDRPIIEMGSRRVHEQAAIAVARAAYIAGFSHTSNLAASRLYGVPTKGTAAHAFVLSADNEVEAFRNQIDTHGVDTTLLVDTYDTEQGIRNAVAVANEFDADGPGAIRIDSGNDLGDEARKARTLLDSLGATRTRVTMTSDLDEFAMTVLADAPVDGYGAGTRVATGSGHPTAKMVYKLVAIEGTDEHGVTRMISKAKNASGKKSVGGRKMVWRTYDRPCRDGGRITGEVHAIGNATVAGANLAHIQVPLVENGRVVHAVSTEGLRTHAAHALASLPPGATDVSDGEPAIVPTVVTETTARALQEA